MFHNFNKIAEPSFDLLYVSKGKLMKNSPRFKRNRLSQAIALACLSAVTVPVAAGNGSCPTAGANTISTAVAAECELVTGDSVNITSSGSITSTDYGVSVYNGSVVGDITNAGIITSDDFGIYVYGEQSVGAFVNGNITNSGTIISDDEGGIFLYGTVIGNIDNSGLIDGDGQGIYLYGASGASTVAGNITNSGTILSADEDGMFLYGTVIGNVDNSGLINADERGIYIYGSVGGDLINSGTIIGGDEGISLIGSISGDINNSGLIETEGTGIYLYGAGGNAFVGGDVINSGTIISNADSGIFLYGTIAGDINNSGLIEADGHGIYLYGANGASLVEGNITNSGTIISASESGIYVYGKVLGGIDNSGLIQGANNGIYLDDPSLVSGDVTNSGTIEATSDTGFSFSVESGADFAGTLINSGTLLGGLDMDTGDVNNSGLLDTRGVASNVNDDYTQTATGILRLDATDAATFGTLTAGTATFAADSGIQVRLDPAHTLVAGDVLNDVITAGALSASTFTIGDNLLASGFTAAVDGNTVDLTLFDTGLTTIKAATVAAGYSGGAGAAGVLDTFMTDDPFGDVAFSFGSLNTEQEIADAVETVVPVLSGGLSQASHGFGSTFTDIVGSRQDAHNGISSGDGMFVSHGLWLKPFGGWADQDDRDGVSGYDIESYGFAFGVDSDVSSSWNIGIAGTVSRSDIDSDALGSHTVDVDTVLGKVYGTYRLSDVTAINLQAGVGTSDYESSRSIFTGSTAVADYDSMHYLASAELTRNFRYNDKSNYAPYVRIDYSYVDVDNYAESGGGAFALTVADDSNDRLVFSTGVKGNYSYSDDLLLLGNVGIGYDAQADRTNLTSAFAGGGGQFTTSGIDPGALVYDVGVGVKYALVNGTEVTARYDLNGRDDYTDQSFSVNVRWMFY